MIFNRIIFIGSLILTVGLAVSCTSASIGEPQNPTMAPAEADVTEANGGIEATETAPATSIPNEGIGEIETAPFTSGPEEHPTISVNHLTPTSNSPTQTPPTATATPSSITSPSSIDLPILNRSRPKDILQETQYFSGGGGGASNCFDLFSALFGDVQSSWAQLPPNFVLIDPEGAVDWHSSIFMATCGWNPSEPVVITLSLEGEVIDSWDEPVDDSSGVFLYFGFARQHPPGLYEFSFTGKEGGGEIREISHTVRVLPPPKPSLYHFFNTPSKGTGEIMLTGFQPGETVRIIVYAEKNNEDWLKLGFTGWATVQADSDGTLFVSTEFNYTEFDPVVFHAVGELSGEAKSMDVFTSGGIISSTESTVYIPDTDTTCPGLLPTRLTLGSTARVVANRLNVREGPGPQFTTVYGTSISQGRIVTILDGPVCDDGTIWWKGETGIITLTNGQQHNIIGWMAEQSGDKWLLEPLP